MITDYPRTRRYIWKDFYKSLGKIEGQRLSDLELAIFGYVFTSRDQQVRTLEVRQLVFEYLRYNEGQSDVSDIIEQNIVWLQQKRSNKKYQRQIDVIDDLIQHFIKLRARTSLTYQQFYPQKFETLADGKNPYAAYVNNNVGRLLRKKLLVKRQIGEKRYYMLNRACQREEDLRNKTFNQLSRLPSGSL